jgi:hypothetical protein
MKIKSHKQLVEEASLETMQKLKIKGRRLKASKKFEI